MIPVAVAPADDPTPHNDAGQTIRRVTTSAGRDTSACRQGLVAP